jgi:hypothetical protein
LELAGKCKDLLVIPVDVEFVAAICVLALQCLFHEIDFVFGVSGFFKGPKGVAAVWSSDLLGSFAFGATYNYFSHAHIFALLLTVEFSAFNIF